jgi:hypothetical protein
MKVNQKESNNIEYFKKLDKMTKKQLIQERRQLLAQMRKIEKEEGVTAPARIICKICNKKIN